MIKLTEQQIEDLIYNDPWLLDERYVIPNIKGSRGEKARQVNVFNGNNKFIDLVFKNSRTNRPVIVELKKGKLRREDIAQILEYRTLLLLLDEVRKQEWINEFGNNYYVPELILIVKEAAESDIISANLTGIELKVFGSKNELDIGFDSFNDLKTKINEWESFRSSGNRTLIEREEWYQEIIDKVNKIVGPYGLKSISKPQQIKHRGIEDVYIQLGFPFLNIPVYFDDKYLLGVYEYFDEVTPFDDEYFYTDLGFIYTDSTIKNDEDWEDVKKEILKIKSTEISLIDFEITDATFKVKREVLSDDKKLKKVLELLITKGTEIFNKFYKEKD